MKQFFKWTGYVILPIALLFFIALLNRESLGYYFLKNGAQFYAGRTHISLNIGGISGNPFSETTLENITIHPVKEFPQAYSFKADTITCTYNLWDLKEGSESFLKGLSCSASSPEISYDFRSAARQDQSPDAPGQFLLPAVLPNLDVHNGSVILTNAEWDAEIRKIDSSLRPAADGGHALHLQVNSLRFSQDGATKIETGFTSLLQYTESKLTIASFEVGDKEISATGFIDLAQIHSGLAGFAANLGFAESQLNVTGSIENKLLKALVRTDNFDISELQKRLGGSGWDISGKIRGEADLTYNLESEQDLNGTVTLNVRDGELHGVGIDSFSLSSNFDDTLFNIVSAEARTPDNHILLSDVMLPMALLQEGKVLSTIGGSRAKFTIDITDFSTLLQLLQVEDNPLPGGVKPNSLTIKGSLDKGAVYLDEAIAVTSESSLTINQAIIPIPATVEGFESVPINLAARFESSSLGELAGLFGETPLTGQVTADMRVTGTIKDLQGKITLSGEYLGYKKLQLGSLALHGELRASQEKPGTLQSIQFTVTGLTQTNNSGTLVLLSPATGTWKPENFSVNGTFQVDGQGEIAIRTAKSPGKEATVEISASNLESDGWLGNFMDNRYFFHGAVIEAVFTGLPKNPYAQLRGSIKETGGAGMPFPLTGSFALQYSSKGIEISEFAWQSHERNKLTITGFLPYDPVVPQPFLDSELTLDAHVDFPALEDIAVFLEPLGLSRGSVVLDMGMTGSWKQPLGHILLKVQSLEPPDKLKQYSDAPLDIVCDLAAERGSILLNSASLKSSDYSAEASGSWQHGLTARELLQKNKTELGGDMAAEATVELKNLNFLKKKLTWLRRFDGNTRMKIHMAGPVRDPAVTGSFSLEDGEVSHTFNFPMLSAVNLQGDFDEHSITLKNMLAEVGGAPINLSGKINREEQTVTVNLHAEGKNLLLFRNNDMRMRGDVQLNVSGPLARLVIKGTTGLTGGYYTRNIDFLSKIGSSAKPVSEGVSFLFSFSDPPLKNAVFDIKITTIEPFRIRNNLIRGVLRPELSLKGTGELPFLVGTIYIDPSRVLLPSGRLQVQSGLVRFLEGEPDRPQLDLLAQSKVLNYDINVVTQGPLDDPVITLSSNPALPNDDLLLLLLTGQPPKEDVAGGTTSSATTNIMVYLGRDFFSKWLENESGASDETILDRFELDYGRGVTKSGEQTVEGSFRLSELKPGKRKVYYLSAEKDKYDAYNYGLKLVFRFE